jgi:hypothetical protein
MERSRRLGVILLAGVAALLGAGASRARNAAANANTAAAPLPKDIDPESRNRLPVPKSDGLSDDDKKIFDAMTHGQAASVRLYSPKLAQSLGDAQNYLKSETGFGDPLTEIAVLVASREMDSQFLWTIWEKHGRDLKDSRHIDAESSTRSNMRSRWRDLAKRKRLLSHSGGSCSDIERFRRRRSRTRCVCSADAAP